MSLDRNQLRYVIFDHTIVPSVVNVIINAGFAWSYVIGRDAVLLGGWTGVLVDLIATSMLLPFLFCLIATLLIRRDLKSARIAPLSDSNLIWRPIRSLPKSVRRRAIRLALLVLFTALPVTALLLWAFGVTEMMPGEFVAFKLGYVLVLSIGLGPVIVLRELADPGGRPA